MSLRRHPFAPRIVASLLFAGLIAAGAGPSAALERESDSAEFERCVGCAGCEAGDCDGAPEPGHDHCCASTCWGHTAWLLSAPGSLAEPPSRRARRAAPALGGLEQPASPVFHPPRS